MYFTRKTGSVLGAAMLLAAAGTLAASPASAQPLSQLWQTSRSGAPGMIFSKSSGQCLAQDTVAGIGVPVATLQDCTGARNQIWVTSDTGRGLIFNVSSRQCLAQDTVAGIGVPVATLQDCTGAANQFWFNEPGRLGPISNERSQLDLTEDTVAGIGLPVATLQQAG
jgi:acetyl-CoA carboxylase carboxyltransferase component